MGMCINFGTRLVVGVQKVAHLTTCYSKNTTNLAKKDWRPHVRFVMPSYVLIAKQARPYSMPFFIKASNTRIESGVFLRCVVESSRSGCLSRHQILQLTFLFRMFLTCILLDSIANFQVACKLSNPSSYVSFENDLILSCSIVSCQPQKHQQLAQMVKTLPK